MIKDDWKVTIENPELINDISINLAVTVAKMCNEGKISLKTKEVKQFERVSKSK